MDDKTSNSKSRLVVRVGVGSCRKEAPGDPCCRRHLLRQGKQSQAKGPTGGSQRG